MYLSVNIWLLCAVLEVNWSEGMDTDGTNTISLLPIKQAHVGNEDKDTISSREKRLLWSIFRPFTCPGWFHQTPFPLSLSPSLKADLSQCVLHPLDLYHSNGELKTSYYIWISLSGHSEVAFHQCAMFCSHYYKVWIAQKEENRIILHGLKAFIAHTLAFLTQALCVVGWKYLYICSRVWKWETLLKCCIESAMQQHPTWIYWTIQEEMYKYFWFL